MLAPALLLCGIFIFMPAALTIVGSFYTFGLTSQNWVWAGLDNYAQAALDPIFWVALRNNVIIVIGSIVLQVGIGTVLAAILDRGLPRGSTFFRTIIFMPMVVSAVAVALIWLIILDPNIGILNALVKGLGLTPPQRGWLGDPNISIWMVLVVAAWQYTGFMMVLILAGLQGIPKEHYEAAALDGARGLKAFWYITLPSIRNVLAGRGADHHDRRLQGLRFRLRAHPGRTGQRHPGAGHLHLPAGLQPHQHGLRQRHRRGAAGDRRRPGLDAAQGEPEGMMSSFRLASVVLYGLVSLWSLFVLLPLLWMVFAAFKTRREIFTDPLGLPDTLNFQSFERAWGVGVGQFILNSAFVTVMSVGLIVVVSGMAAYVLARSDNKWLQVVYLLIVAGFAVPVTAVLVPLFQMVSAAGFLNNHLAIVLPYAAYGIPFTTILFYAFFLDFPRELEEAARLDGCSRMQIFFRVIVPLSGPAVASAAIFQAVFIWNEFLLALLMLTRPALKTLPVGILQLQGEFTSDWPAVMAGLAMATVPILAVFVFSQKYFVRSLAGLGK